ncbi:MFS transporter [Actinomadura flavalba]|uniref:MFS transporter n=1 Tax=Actinomadura flavalba TaxID=1120938 RepID=UPI000363778E|nr:MFS transporter [Actinomadura flavalba]
MVHDPRSPARLLRGDLRLPTLGIVLVTLLLAFESMAVSTVMPVIAPALDGQSLYAWGFSASLITMLLATVLTGGLADRIGPGLPLLTGIAVFVAGLAVGGSAPEMAVFIAGRALQGLGTGSAMVAMYVLIARVYPDTLRPRVFGALAAAWVLPSLLGPAVAGFVAAHAGWRWVFLGLIPLVVPAAAMLVPALRRLVPAPAAAAPARAVPAVAVTAGAALLLYALENPGWTALPLGAAGLAGLGFGLPRLLPPGTLTMRPGLPSVVLARGLLSGAFLGADVFIPLALTGLHGFSPTQAGVALSAGAVAWSAAAQLQGRSERPGTFFALLGAVLVAVGVIGVTVAEQVHGWLALPAWMFAGGGMGLAISALSVLTLDRSPADRQGVNSAALQISDTLGAALVIGTGGAVLAAFGPDRLGTGLAVAGAFYGAVALLGVLAARRIDAPVRIVDARGAHPSRPGTVDDSYGQVDAADAAHHTDRP